MTSPAIAATPETHCKDAAALMVRHRISALPVVDSTGDHPDVGSWVAAAVGADAVVAERTPADNVTAVQRERTRGVTVMVGDGVNDAPALAAADVGVAMGVRGVSASSEAADVVMTVDRLDRLAEGLCIARRARKIAMQSVVAGMSLSVAAMAVAAAGMMTVPMSPAHRTGRAGHRVLCRYGHGRRGPRTSAFTLVAASAASRRRLGWSAP